VLPLVGRREGMSVRVAIIGGSVAGLAAAILLARQGHDVQVFDGDDIRPAPDVEAAARGAWRAGAPHSPHGHGLPSLGRHLLLTRLADVREALLANGVVELPMVMPPTITERSPDPRDDELRPIATRRSTFEWVFRTIASREPGVTLHGGAKVTGLVTEDGVPPRVRGIEVAGHGTVIADVVVDAGGRRSSAPAWLVAAGARAPDIRSAECALLYYTRHFRVRPGESAPPRPPTQGGVSIVTMLPFGAVLLFVSDNDAVQLSMGTLADDRPMKALRHTSAYDAYTRLIPALEPWLRVLEPISEIWSMSAPRNVLRRDVVDGAPIALGLLAIGDAVCSTNPSFGRGMSLALSQAASLADVVAAHPRDPLAQGLALDERIGRDVAPFFEDQVALDTFRVASNRAAVFGTPAPAPVLLANEFTLPQIFAAIATNALVWRAWMRRQHMLDNASKMFADPVVLGLIRGTTAPAPQLSNLPTRDDVLRAIGNAATA
jgi:2-polyprenyl-6-methoxyphenol hydroxylase-like FAD-dependent oxidoreductase